MFIGEDFVAETTALDFASFLSQVDPDKARKKSLSKKPTVSLGKQEEKEEVDFVKEVDSVSMVDFLNDKEEKKKEKEKEKEKEEKNVSVCP